MSVSGSDESDLLPGAQGLNAVTADRAFELSPQETTVRLWIKFFDWGRLHG